MINEVDNGLWRYNQAGKFNAPFGSYKKPYFPELELRYFAERSQYARFFCLPFEDFLKKARLGYVIYCDPPYVPLNKTAYFTNYTAVGFSLSAQHKLVACAVRLMNRKLPVIVSNHDTEFTRKLYHQAVLHYFKVRRSISCIGKNRCYAEELLAIF